MEVVGHAGDTRVADVGAVEEGEEIQGAEERDKVRVEFAADAGGENGIEGGLGVGIGGFEGGGCGVFILCG